MKSIVGKKEIDENMKLRKYVFTFIDKTTPLLIMVIGMSFGWGLGSLSFGYKPSKTWYVMTTLCGLLLILFCITFNVIVDNVIFVFKDSHGDNEKKPESDFVPNDGYDDGFRETIDEPSKPFPTIFISYGTETKPDIPSFIINSTTFPDSRLVSWIEPTWRFHEAIKASIHPSDAKSVEDRERKTIEMTRKVINKATIVDMVAKVEES